MNIDSENISSKDNPDSFYAGSAKVDITPPLGTSINGDFVAHYAHYVHDKLYAKALVLQRGGTVVAIVVVDICTMSKDFLDVVKLDIKKQVDIDPANVLISSTHTHAAGSIESIYLSPADPLYVKKLPGCIINAVQQARDKLQVAKVAFGKVDVPQHVLCRRYAMKDGYKASNPVTGNLDQVKTNPIGAKDQIDHSISHTDPQVSFLCLRGNDGKWISILGNYSLHYVGDWNNGTITADYFGEFSRQIHRKLDAGDDFVGIMTNGTSADVNIMDFFHSQRYPSEDFKKTEVIGGDIAEKVFQALENVEWETNPLLRPLYKEMTLSLRKPTSDELQIARKLVAESDYENLKANHDTDEGLRQIYAREQVLLNEFPDNILFPLQAIRIGQTIVGALGGEIFAETGLWLKENSSNQKYFTIGLANGCVGYIPPAQEIKRGGYETWRSRFSNLEVNAEKMIKEKLLELINSTLTD